MPFPIPIMFITAVKDICATNTFEKLLNILFSQVSTLLKNCLTFYLAKYTVDIHISALQHYCFSATITDMSLYEVLNLFPR